jgi:hypothetical protein
MCLTHCGASENKLKEMKKSLFTALAVGLGLTANLMAQVPSYVPTNGLVGYWPFNGNANDESGNGNNGTVNGATLTADRFGVANRAYYFSGNSNNITTSLKQINISQYSFATWFKTIDGGWIFTGRQINSGDVSIRMLVNRSGLAPGNGVLFGTDGDGYTDLTTSDNDFNDGDWHLAVGVWDGSSSTNVSELQMKVYIDGGLVSQTPSSSVGFGGLHPLIPINGDGFCKFGISPDPSQISTSFIGILDDIGIWNRALTQQEITDLYHSCNNSLSISPQNNSLLTGNTATFDATTSDANATFSWQSDFGQGFQTLNDFGNYSGTNTNALSISNVQLANHNQPIRAISSNTNCTDTSDVANIQIADTCITNVTVYDTLLTTVTDTLVINTTLSLPAPNNENTILIYPNPANNHITIDNGNYAAMSGYTIKIQNNAGQQVFQSAINQQQFYVDLSTWSGNGLYFVHLIDPQNNTVTVRKIVLQ